MLVNSSSFDDILPSSSNSSLHPLTNSCFRSEMTIYIFSAFSIAYILPLPLFIFVLYLGYQQRRKQRSVPIATSDSDLFTYHSIIIQLNEILGFIFFFCGDFMNLPDMRLFGLGLFCINTFGQALFQILSCVERYLAVVHPITYLGLKQAGGVRIRKICIGCVWLLCFGYIVVHETASYEFLTIFYYCGTAFILIIISFCSILVLCTLKRPGLGEKGGNRKRVDQSKQRAFHIIIAIMGVQLLKFGGNLIANVIYSSDICLLMISIIWFGLPSTLVLPLLFLHRTGKLPFCKRTTGSRGG